MSLAIFADTHGNLSALNAALKDTEQFGVTDFLCLGDVANFGPNPKETLRRVRDLNCPVVMGNTDAYLLEPRTLGNIKQPDENTEFFLEVEAWSAAQLDEDDLRFVRTFAPTHSLTFEGVTLLGYHGSPLSYDDQIEGTTPDDTLDTYFQDVEAAVYAGGHTHTQFVRRYYSSRLMNPGSVGISYVKRRGSGDFVNHAVAEYALLEVLDGEPNITLRRVPYDLQDVFDAVQKSAMPFKERWLEGFEAR